MGRSAAGKLLVVLAAVSACTSTPPPSSSAPSQGTAQSSTPSVTATLPSPSESPTPTPPATTLAGGVALPACESGAPTASETVTFVASGQAWALDPGDASLTCLFDVEDAGPFQWGPLGDRALLGGLEVKGVAGGPSLAAGNQPFTAITWSRPTGKSIVYIPASGESMQKVQLNGGPDLDVTPLPSTTYLSVAYHPSGEAFVFAADQGGAESILISSNLGKTPGRLVFTEQGTKFGAMGFDVDGRHLLYAAQHADNHADLHSIDITDPTTAPEVWSGEVGRMILDIKLGLLTGTVAWTTGTSCEDSIAMAHSAPGTIRALPDEDRPTVALGWLSATQVLVAAGGCGALLDLSAVDVSSGSIVPLVSGVDVAAVRTPVPTPPARLPASVATLGSGFS